LFPLLGIYKNELSFFTKHQWWLWTYLQNWLYSFYLISDAKFLTHLWSLAVEEQFYLIWPFIILLIKKPKRLFYVMLLILISVIITRSVIWLYRIEDLNYTTLYTFTRIDGICIGSMIALLMQYKPDIIAKNLTFVVLTLAFLNFIFYFINQQGNYSYPYFAFVGYTTFCAMFGLLIHEVVINNDKYIANRILSFRPLIFFGKISYGFYVYHWPVYIMANAYFLNYLKNNTGLSDYYTRMGGSLLSTILAIIISVISYHFFEKYFLNLKNKFT
jgi:peptidoglycan/LPS O-acetylase OafA/YrhL